MFHKYSYMGYCGHLVIVVLKVILGGCRRRLKGGISLLIESVPMKQICIRVASVVLFSALCSLAASAEVNIEDLVVRRGDNISTLKPGYRASRDFFEEKAAERVSPYGTWYEDITR